MLEYAARGDFGSIFRKFLPTEENIRTIRLPILIDVAKCFAYFETLNPPLVHRDLKPENILVKEDFLGKVSDLGESHRLGEKENIEIAGSPFYIAPEVYKNEEYDSKIDVYSFG